MPPTEEDRPWTGQWIWCQDRGIDFRGEFLSDPRIAASAVDRRVLFRRSFELAVRPVTAPLRITADSRYVLWVNGTEVARGPARCQPYRLLYDEVDVADALRAGTNTVAVSVRFYGRPTAWWMPARITFSHGAGGLLAELGLPEGTLGTDASWRYRPGAAWTPQEPAGMGRAVPEVVDGAELDPDWPDPGYDDADWRPARVVAATHLGGTRRTRPPTDPYGVPRPRPFAMPVPRDRPARVFRVARAPLPGSDAGPAEVVPGAHRSADPGAPATGLPLRLMLDAEHATVITADWCEMVAGTVTLDLDAPAGTTADVQLAERLDDQGHLPAGDPRAIRYRTRGGGERFEAADPAGGRYAVLVLRGSGPVTVRQVLVRERIRPRPAGASFHCDDAELTMVHRAGLRTVDLCAQDAYIDGPGREQRAWVGDSVVHQSVDLLNNPDWGLARWQPQLCASPRPDGMLPMAVAGDVEFHGTTDLPDWSLHWIRSVHNLYRWAADRETVAGLLPVAENVLRWFARFRRGGLLTDVTGWVLLDWASVQGAGAGAVLNGLWGRALRDFAEMAEWLGDHGRAGWARQQHRDLVAAFQLFWDPGRGTYRDWSSGPPFVSEHAAAAAVTGGLVPPAHRPMVRRFLLGRDRFVRSAWSFGAMPLRQAMGPPAPDWDVAHHAVAAQPFFRYVVHDALAELGAADAVAELCRDWVPLLAAGAGTFPETWAGGSACHGWSATPARDLPRYVLGVSPAAPGFARARVEPAPGRLSRLGGQVPTPAGPIEVEIEAGELLRVKSPVPLDVVVRGVVESRPAGEWSRPWMADVMA